MDYQFLLLGLVVIIVAYLLYHWVGLDKPMPEGTEIDWYGRSYRIQSWCCFVFLVVAGIGLIVKSLLATP